MATMAPMIPVRPISISISIVAFWATARSTFYFGSFFIVRLFRLANSWRFARALFSSSFVSLLVFVYVSFRLFQGSLLLVRQVVLSRQFEVNESELVINLREFLVPAFERFRLVLEFLVVRFELVVAFSKFRIYFCQLLRLVIFVEFVKFVVLACLHLGVLLGYDVGVCG